MKRSEIQTEQQKRNALDKFKNWLALPIKILEQIAFNIRPTREKQKKFMDMSDH